MLNIHQINAYMHQYSSEKSNFATNQVSWEQAKSKRLFDLFGGQLILEKPVEYFAADEELLSQVKQNLKLSEYRLNLIDALLLSSLSRLERIEVRKAVSFKNFIAGSIDRNLDAKGLKLTKGTKTFKALKKIIQHFHLPIAEADTETFRIEISKIIAERRTKGILCLSIHPLDYMTMSDNNHCWSSCMSWRERGCFRCGTISTMNCENTIVAYLKPLNNKKDLKFGDYSWNSKIWRRLIHVTDDMILGNRHYPRKVDALGTMSLEWVLELANKNLNAGFSNTPRHIDNLEHFYILNEYMYSDLDMPSAGDCFLKPLAESVKDLVLGGEAYCLECGERLDTEYLTCSRC